MPTCRCIERYDSISHHLNRTLAQELPAPDASRERAARAVAAAAVGEGGDEGKKAKKSGNAVVVGKKEGLAYNTREQVIENSR